MSQIENQGTPTNKTPIFSAMWAHHEIRTVVYIALAATAFVFVIYALAFSRTGLPVADSASWGQFGDFIGGVIAAVLGLITLYLVLATVYFTHHTMALSSENLRTTKEELAATRRVMDLQTFDSRMTFLLKLFQEVRLGLSVTYTNPSPDQKTKTFKWVTSTITGPRVISSQFKSILDRMRANLQEDLPGAEVELIVADFWRNFEDDNRTRPYFASLAAMLRLIEVTKEGKAINPKPSSDNPDLPILESIDIFNGIISSYLSDDEKLAAYLYSKNTDFIDSRNLKDFLLSVGRFSMSADNRVALERISKILDKRDWELRKSRSTD